MGDSCDIVMSFCMSVFSVAYYDSFRLATSNEIAIKIYVIVIGVGAIYSTLGLFAKAKCVCWFYGYKTKEATAATTTIVNDV